MIQKAKCLSLIALAVLAGCAIGPNYHRPAIQTPAEFRFAENQTTNSISDLSWWIVFNDPLLQALIGTALTNNYGLKQAVFAAASHERSAGIGGQFILEEKIM
jgi:outer membrane protein, multidrug efflux system